MAGKTNNSAVAIAIQPTRDVFVAPTVPGELMSVSQLRPQINSVTIANDEMTGSVVANADAVAGKTYSQSFNVKLRPPPGGTMPAANAFLLGRLLQSLKFSELRNADAIPAAPAALGNDSTTSEAVLGADAAATADLYKGFPLLLSDNGVGFKRQLTMIRHYGADKAAELMETLTSAPAANWQIPPFLGYFRDVSSADPIKLSMQTWLDGYRFDLVNVGPTSAQLVFPTSTETQAAFPELQVTMEGTISATADDPTPAIPALGAVPLFKDGDMHLNRVPIGGQSFTIDLGLSSERPPNPNQTDGSDAPEITGSTARISMQRQRYLKNVIDTLALADAQAYHPFWAQYGAGAGTMLSIGAPDVRLAHPSPDLGGQLINETGDLLVDALDRGIAIVFPLAA